GIVHRDLKPENVMLCPRPDGTTRAVVMDFGLAKERRVGAEVRKLTATGIVLGTPEFMSPEQLRGKALDARSDIYSLGLMTYELLTGQLPFSGKTQQDMMIARLKGDPTPLRAMRPELGFSAAVEKVLLRSLARDPGDRYATAPPFASAFASAARERGLSGECALPRATWSRGMKTADWFDRARRHAASAVGGRGHPPLTSSYAAFCSLRSAGVHGVDARRRGRRCVSRDHCAGRVARGSGGGAG